MLDRARHNITLPLCVRPALCAILDAFCPTDVVPTSLMFARKLLRLMLELALPQGFWSLAASVRSYRFDHSIFKASVTVWLPPYPYIDLQIPPLACGIIPPQHYFHLPHRLFGRFGSPSSLYHLIHSPRQPSSSNPIPLSKQPSIQPPRLEYGMHP